MGNPKNKIKEVCPRGLDTLPCEACPLAMERINALKAEGAGKKSKDLDNLPGCKWYVASRENHYCFWHLADTLQDDPRSDREICDTLLISQENLDATFQAVVRKWNKIKDSDQIRALKDAVAELARLRPIDYANYIPDDFRNLLKQVEENVAPSELGAPDKPKVIKRDRGMPLHRDGHKKDLYGLYSPKTRERLEKEKKKKKETDEDESEK